MFSNSHPHLLAVHVAVSQLELAGLISSSPIAVDQTFAVMDSTALRGKSITVGPTTCHVTSSRMADASDSERALQQDMSEPTKRGPSHLEEQKHTTQSLSLASELSCVKTPVRACLSSFRPLIVVCTTLICS